MAIIVVKLRKKIETTVMVQHFSAYSYSRHGAIINIMDDTDTKKTLNGQYKTYVPFRALIEASQMRRYHEKFNFSGEGCIYNSRQKSRRWAVLIVLLIVGTFC